VDGSGNVWLATGNAAFTSSNDPYDNSDGVIELNSALVEQQSFAPSAWYEDNGVDADLGSSSPALMGNGLVFQAGKSQTTYVMSQSSLGGVGGQLASAHPYCGNNVDGGNAVSGTIVYAPCQGGVVATQVTAGSPPTITLLWQTPTGSGGPPIVAGNLVWTIDPNNANLYGLDPVNGDASQTFALGSVANHFPTPAVADGLLLAASSNQVHAFAGPAGLPPPPTATVPRAPTDLTATPGNSTVSLSWSAPSDAGSPVTGYDVYEGTTSGGESTTPVNGATPVTTTSYAVSSLTNGTRYYFTVEALNAVGSSVASNEASATPSSNPCVVYTGNDAFVCAAYEDLLGRTPDSGGLGFWVAQLGGGTSRSAVAGAIAGSTEYRVDLVNGYYETFLGRAGDSGGLGYWVAQLKAGATDQSVLAAILGSGQFYADSGGTPGGFVTALYEGLLGRAPDSGGLGFWESQLSSRTPRGAVAGAIEGSSEYRSDFVEARYAHLLGRGADAGGLSFWVAQLAGGASNESVIAAIVGSSEFYTDATTL
jgi:hypothetical protein